MATHILPHAAQMKGFVYQQPDGTKRFAGHVAFDDRQIWRHRSDFDGREEVKVHFPTSGQRWAGWRADYKGTTPNLYDIHTLALDAGTGGLDIPKLLSHGFAGSARIGGPLAGSDQVHLQSYGQNAKVYDVGEVDERGINSISPVTATQVSGRHLSPKTISEGETVHFSSSSFGRPGNLWFEIDVFAPEATPRAGVSRDQQRAVLDQLDIRIESDFMPPGDRNRRMRYVNNVGPEGNNVRLSWGLANPSNFQGQGYPPTGVYPFRIMKGHEVVRRFNLAWNDNA